MKKGLFNNKNFILVFLGAMVSNIGAILYNFAVSYYILDLSNNNAFLQGCYLACTGLVFVLTSIFGGVFSDRYHKGKIMALMDYLKGGTILLGVLVAPFLKSNNSIIVLLFIIGILGNVFSAFFHPASSAILPEIVDENRLQQANSYFSLMNSVESIVGVILAGVLYSLLPMTLLLLVVGVCFVFSGISEMFIKIKFKKLDTSLTLKEIFIEYKSGLTYLNKEKTVLFLMIIVLFINFFFSPLDSNFIPYFIKTSVSNNDYLGNRLFAPEVWNSIFSIGFGIGSIISSIILSNLPQKEKCNGMIKTYFIVLSLSNVIVSFLLFFFYHNVLNINTILISLVVHHLLVGVSIVFINVPISTTMLLRIEKKNLGKVQSIMTSVTQALIPISVFVGGIITSTFGPFMLCVCCTFGFLLSAFIFIIHPLSKGI